ncbi:hypothetical protein ES288_A04G120100v1 [Gossypium darwinii]|uniref:Laccase n=1 Tax=Gossypium darwinii TaxID=34276 RepID=A0A5D2GVT3_GOSDA|nr:hypothetical protein ES288_A04G120100v1 [Gossypium darwinii]
MRNPVLLLVGVLTLMVATTASAAVVEHTFNVQNLTVTRLCNRQLIVAVNGSFPGPRIRVREGDTLIVHVYNKSPYNLTVHWHGVYQKLSCWADGPNMITQCPILPGNKYTYKFKISGQEGTLWWHSHVSWLRATVHGALIIRPKSGHKYPFPKPHREVTIILGEWWNADVMDVEEEAVTSGGLPNISDAFTINGWPGDLYPCSQNHMYKLKVEPGKTYLLRIVNTALNGQLFYKIANHNLTVFAIDAAYTKPYVTDIIMIAPGQTVDALLVADQDIGSYYMAASPYSTSVGIPYDNNTTRGVVVYDGAPPIGKPLMPTLPAFSDTATAYKLSSSLKGLKDGPHWAQVPKNVDYKMFVTVGLGFTPCEANRTCLGPKGTKLSASMNNQSFVPPKRMSSLQAFYSNVDGIYTTDFPVKPPIEFDYTNATINNYNPAFLFAPKVTKVTKLKFNSTVEMVLQNTAIIGVENHPMHLHGSNFHVLAQGFGNYNPSKHREMFNLVDPQIRNTIGVPAGGWAVIRFTADNPGVWIMHCHLDAHLTYGLGTVFMVENGPTPETTLPLPPVNLPNC